MSEETKALMRKYRSNIEISGLGIIAFGTWQMLKMLLGIFIENDDISKFSNLIENQDIASMRRIIVVVVIIFGVLVLCFHVYIGASAIKYARKKSNKTKFLFWALCLFILSALSFVVYIVSSIRSEIDDGVVITLFVDLTFISILADMLYSYYRIKKMGSKEELGE